MRIELSGITNAAMGRRGSGAHRCVAGVAITTAGDDFGGEACASTSVL